MPPCTLTFVLFVSVGVAGLAVPAGAETRRVCASGCQYSGLQAAIDAAAPGDTILLKAGETFVGPFVLRRKASSTQWITIRTDTADSLLPGEGVRLVPSGKPGATTQRSLLPRLVGQGGTLKTTPVVRTESGAQRYILRFLEIDGVANLGWETLIAIGDDTANATASHIVIDRVYAHGHAQKGMKRGIALNSAHTDVLNSYISDVKAVGFDSQGIAGYNGPGPFRIINNYIEGAAENIMFGGSDPAITGLVPSNIEIRRNHLYKPLAWRQPILAVPASPKGSASSTAGKLSAGTHYFRVVAVMGTAAATAVSAPSTAVGVTVSANQSAALTWTAVSGADRYRIYRGSSASTQGVFLETAGSGTSFTYTANSEKSGTPPASGTKWTVKNLLELKSAEHVLIEGNVMENVWQAGQAGYALMLTPRNQDGKATWTRVRDVMIRSNIIRNASGVMQVVGYDNNYPSQQTQRVTLRNNLFHGIDPATWGGSAKAYLIGEGAADVVIDRNTLIHTNSSVAFAYGKLKMLGFVYTNNISQHHAYGIMADNGRPGQYSIDLYFPDGTVTNNVLAGGTASAYPTPNAFPTVEQWKASFVDLAAGDYRLKSTSVFISAGAGGSMPGADMGVLNAALAGTATPPPSEPAPTPPPDDGGTTNTPPIARPGGPYTVAAGATVVTTGSASSDAEGPIAAYQWTWGDEILINAADVPAGSIVGTRWSRVQAPGAAGGWAIHNPDKGEANKKDSPLASPGSYVNVQFYAAAGVPYRMWLRMRAQNDHYNNDSLFVQFDRSVNAQGQAIHRIGSASAAIVVLEEGNGAGVSGWGWNDSAYGGTALGAPVYFATSGLQTLRIQQREDGVMWDQIVLSSGEFFGRRPGATKLDTTIVPGSFGSSEGMTGSHTYKTAAVYPLVLTVADAQGAVGWAMTTVTVGAPVSSTALVAQAGGPYEGVVGQATRFDGSGSSVPAGVTAQYRWTFGEEIVLQAPIFTAVGSRWRKISDATAASGTALENPLANSSKLSTAAANPTSYVEATFRAAAGVPYRLWVRMRAANDAWANDSIFVQFSGTVSSSGAAVTRIGTTGAQSVILEEGHGAGLSGWGWADADYGGLAPPIYFNQDGVQTIRIQQREDGLRIDQIVISAAAHFSAAPGSLKNDNTMVPVFGAGSTGVTVQHIYRTPGTYPVTLTLDGGTAGVVTDSTAIVVR
ncbi:hypothetical protein BH23ACI1_BH23ACI1_11250 [soil metagenome]